MSRQAVLTINTGSSSIKLAAFETVDGQLGDRLIKASLSGLRGGRSFRADTDQGRIEELPHALAERGLQAPDLVAALARWARARLDPIEVRAVGHRVVHGGRDFTGPVRAHPDVIEKLGRLSCLAPSHQPDNLAGIEGVSRLWPDLPQTLSFDTAFHRGQPYVAQHYAIPRRLSDEGLLRFGFHGLSYAYIAGRLQFLLPEAQRGRVVVAHLGSGASLCALREGKSVATSMGLTALDGIPMATRSGSVDPGLVLHLIKDRVMTPEEVSDLLYNQSGLLGLSGISGDVRVLLESEDPAASEALAVYVYRIGREISSLAGALGGLDALIFTGGVGENSAEIRKRVCREVSWLGAEADEEANRAGRTAIDSAASRISLLVIPADEESVIANDALSVLSAS